MVGILVKNCEDSQEALIVREQLQGSGFDSFIRPLDVARKTYIQVLAGSFKAPEIAQIHQNKLKAAGFETSIVAL